MRVPSLAIRNSPLTRTILKCGGASECTHSGNRDPKALRGPMRKEETRQSVIKSTSMAPLSPPLRKGTCVLNNFSFKSFSKSLLEEH